MTNSQDSQATDCIFDIAENNLFSFSGGNCNCGGLNIDVNYITYNSETQKCVLNENYSYYPVDYRPLIPSVPADAPQYCHTRTYSSGEEHCIDLVDALYHRSFKSCANVAPTFVGYERPIGARHLSCSQAAFEDILSDPSLMDYPDPDSIIPKSCREDYGFELCDSTAVSSGTCEAANENQCLCKYDNLVPSRDYGSAAQYS